MDKTIYKKANDLYKDIDKLNRQIKYIKENNTWISIMTPRDNDYMGYSTRFRDDLLVFMQNTRDRYQKEFDEL